MNRLPRLAILLGAGGLIPFLVLGFALLIGYGAVILSFLGGVHEGFAILAPAPLPGATKPTGEWTRAESLRLWGASACAVVGWLALVITSYLSPALGLATLIAAFIALPVLEQRAVTRGWMPRPYMWLRWVLSVIVVLVLCTVLVLRLLGAGR
jgi:hypothetical protein